MNSKSERVVGKVKIEEKDIWCYLGMPKIGNPQTIIGPIIQFPRHDPSQ